MRVDHTKTQPVQNVPCRRIDMWSDRWRRADISSAPDIEARLCRVLGGEISTSVQFPTQPPEAYSQSLHKPSCEEMMVQGDEAGYKAEQSADVQGARGWSTAYPAFRPFNGCCVLQLLRWNSLLTRPGFCGGVCCLRGAGDDAMLGKETELQERLATANAFARHH